MTEVAFRTNDTPLAIALNTAGAEWLDPARPWIALYDMQKLKVEGLTLERAKEIGRCDNWFYFKSCDLVKRLVKAWNEMKKKIESENDAALDHLSQEEVMQVLCVGFHKRNVIYKRRKEIPATIHVARGENAFTQIGEHAPKEVLEKFGLV